MFKELTLLGRHSRRSEGLAKHRGGRRGLEQTRRLHSKGSSSRSRCGWQTEVLLCRGVACQRATLPSHQEACCDGVSGDLVGVLPFRCGGGGGGARTMAAGGRGVGEDLVQQEENAVLRVPVDGVARQRKEIVVEALQGPLLKQARRGKKSND